MGQKYCKVDQYGNVTVEDLPYNATSITLKADEYPTILTTSGTYSADPRYFVDGIVTSNDIVPSEPINIKLHFFDITDVRVYNDKVVKVFFADNTFEMAKVDESDTFDLETGIGICITKKALSLLYSPYGIDECASEKSGTYYYNKLIRKALKVMNKRIAEEEKAEREKQAALERRKKKRAKKERRKSRRNRRGWLG